MCLCITCPTIWECGEIPSLDSRGDKDKVGGKSEETDWRWVGAVEGGLSAILRSRGRCLAGEAAASVPGGCERGGRCQCSVESGSMWERARNWEAVRESTQNPLGHTTGRSNEGAVRWQPGMSNDAGEETVIVPCELQGEGNHWR